MSDAKTKAQLAPSASKQTPQPGAKAQTPQPPNPAANTATAAAAASASVPANASGETACELGPDMGVIPAGSIGLVIKVGKAANIRGAKGEKVSSFIKVQMADFDYKESAVAADTSAPDYNFVHDQIFHVDENLVDTIANKKLTITLIESLPKEKTQILGTTDMLLTQFLKYPPRDPNAPATTPYLLPQLSIRETLSINYLNPKLLPPPAKEGDPNNQPELTVEVSLSGPLIPPEVVEQGNFLYFRLDDLFPVPDEWTLKDGNEKDLNSNIYSYAVSFVLPAESVPERVVTITGGSLMHCEAVIPDVPAIGAQPIYAPKPADSNATPGSTLGDGEGSGTLGEAIDGLNVSTLTLGAPVSTGAVGGSSSGAVAGGDGPAGDAALPGNSAKQSFKRVSWGGAGAAGGIPTGAIAPPPYIVWVPPEAVVKLREKIVAKCALDVEFFREMQPKFAHVMDPNAAKYRGKASIDINSLMYPRVTGLRGRFYLDLMDGSVGGGADAAVDHSTGKGKKGGGKEEGAHADSNIYKALGSHIGLEITLEKPLLDKKKLQPISKSVTDFIPRRTIPANMLLQKRSEKADEMFRDQVQEIVKNLVKEYQATLEGLATATAAAAAEAPPEPENVGFENFDIVHPKALDEEQKRKKKFLFHLNKSGAYFNFKEQLKSSVVNVVRERFRKKSPFVSQAELQLFLSELYVYLLDQMHICMHKMFKDVEAAFIDPSVLRTADFGMLKSFADQNELDHDVPMAASYHQERIAKYEDSLQTWFDYGAFCMRSLQMSKGVECFREILSRNSKHVPSLLACGAICTSLEKYEEARVYLVTAVDLQPKYVLALTMLGLYYEITGEEMESEQYIQEAVKVFKTSTSEEKSDYTGILMLKAAEFLVQIHATRLADSALANALLRLGPSVSPYLLLSQLELQRGNPSVAVDHIKSAMQVRQDDPDVWAALGHLQYRQRVWGEAQNSYETVLSLPNEPTNLPLIYIRLGFLYLKSLGSITKKVSDRTYAEVELAKRAKTMYIRACELKPSSQSWTGVAKACILLNQYEEAEESLSEANVRNNRDSEGWAYLALLCLIQDRQFEAGQCISQALHYKLKNPEVLRLTGIAFLEKEQAAPAAECFRLALEADPKDAVTRANFAKAVELQSKDYLKTTFSEIVMPADLKEKMGVK
ncbi:hypothetical protein BJ741DRAFT_607390 [Chytriomyces cf. hyalinus JEL632]|nr:hypothetical protein BJ741DRAFT_607390 [Chytriomyces cf. hyalinus JEL632]